MQITMVEAGRHSAALSQDGRLFVWGPAFPQQKALLVPQELQSNKAMRHISIGERFSLLIDEHGHLYTWGSENRKGQLGREQLQEDMMPQIVEHLETKYVTYAVCGLDFGLALGQNFDQDGNVIEQEMEFNIERLQQPSELAADISKISNIPPSIQRDNTSFLTNQVKGDEHRVETPHLNQRQEFTPSYQQRNYEPPQRDFTPSASYIGLDKPDYPPLNDRYSRQAEDSVERNRPQVNNRVTEYRTYAQKPEVSHEKSASSLPPVVVQSKPENLTSARYERGVTDNTTENYGETVSSAERQVRTLR